MVDAVFFLSPEDSSICKEMLFSEFEAILDGLVDLPEFSGKKIRAVFARIDRKLCLQATVFFLVDFYAWGAADRSWNIPLATLCEQDVADFRLPDGTPIRLIDSDNCTAAGLWAAASPSQKNNCLQQLAGLVRKNSLGIHVDTDLPEKEAVVEPPVVPNAEQQMQLEAEVARLKSELALAGQKARQWLQHHQQRLDQESRKQREQMEVDSQKQLEAGLADCQARLRALQHQHELLQACYRHSEELLPRLVAAGVTFRAYQPGAGEFAVPPDELACYQQDPQAYAARLCGVSAEVYGLWLKHYQQPVCQARRADGQCCGIPLDRENQPQRFIPGVSDHCARHRGSHRLQGHPG